MLLQPIRSEIIAIPEWVEIKVEGKLIQLKIAPKVFGKYNNEAHVDS